MAHPKMFDDADPFLAEIRERALALPDAAEKVSHGRPAIFTTRVFAYYGASMRVDGEWVQHGRALVVKADEDDRVALLEEARGFVPAYLGPAGWIGVDLDETTDWTEIDELLDASYRATAPQASIRRLDATT